MSNTLGDIRVQQRGFGEIVFGDSKNERCSLRQSSAIDQSLDDPFPGTSYVWLGRSDTPMHLDREQVKALRKHLKNWLKEGTF